jgi:hypothetical protein
MMIDDDTLNQPLRVNDELMQLCKWLTEKREMETSSRLIPLVDDLTHILIEAGKNNHTDDATIQRLTSSRAVRFWFILLALIGTLVAVFWRRDALVQSWRSPAFSFTVSP